MNNHEIAVDLIESRFAALCKSGSAMLHGETCMAIEMAYALGAIDTALHRHYVERRSKIIEREYQQARERMGADK